EADERGGVEAEPGDGGVGGAVDGGIAEQRVGAADLEAGAHDLGGAVADEAGDRAAAVDDERETGVVGALVRSSCADGGAAARRAATWTWLKDQPRERRGVAAAEGDRAPKLTLDDDLVLGA